MLLPYFSYLLCTPYCAVRIPIPLHISYLFSLLFSLSTSCAGPLPRNLELSLQRSYEQGSMSSFKMGTVSPCLKIIHLFFSSTILRCKLRTGFQLTHLSRAGPHWQRVRYSDFSKLIGRMYELHQKMRTFLPQIGSVPLLLRQYSAPNCYVSTH